MFGNLKQPTRQDAINWVSYVWDSITPDILIRSFKEWGIPIHSMALKMTWYLMTYLLWIKSQKIKRVRVMVMREIHVLLLMMIDPFSDDSDSDSD